MAIFCMHFSSIYIFKLKEQNKSYKTKKPMRQNGVRQTSIFSPLPGQEMIAFGLNKNPVT